MIIAMIIFASLLVPVPSIANGKCENPEISFEFYQNWSTTSMKVHVKGCTDLPKKSLVGNIGKTIQKIIKECSMDRKCEIKVVD